MTPQQRKQALEWLNKQEIDKDIYEVIYQSLGFPTILDEDVDEAINNYDPRYYDEPEQHSRWEIIIRAAQTPKQVEDERVKGVVDAVERAVSILHIDWAYKEPKNKAVENAYIILLSALKQFQEKVG